MVRYTDSAAETFTKWRRVKLEGTVALVTGAGVRIGRAIAMRLAAAGCDVLVHYRSSRDEAEETAGAIRDLGRRSETARADLADPAEVERLFAHVETSFGRLDILVNSAASFERCAMEDITVEQWDDVQAINVRAPFLCTQHATPLMRGVGDRALETDEPGAPGLVLNLGDHSGVTTWKGFAHHGVSKAALLHLTRVAARELGPSIRVNAIVPGPILPPPGDWPDAEAWGKRGLRVPLGRNGDPHNVASAAVFLARNDYITGDTIFVDGGEHLLAGGRD